MTTPVRFSWAVSDADGEINTLDARYSIGALCASGSSLVAKRSGFFPGPGPSVPGFVAATAVPNNQVTVAPFQGVLSPVRSVPPYIVTSAGAVVFNAFATPPSAAANRRDLVILQQNDQVQLDATNDANLRYIVGNAPAADPAITGSTDYIILAQVTVRQNALEVLQSDIVQRLPAGFRTVAIGGVLPVESVAVRDALLPYTGMTIDRTDRGWQERHDGTAWRVVGTVAVAAVANLADITHPVAGTTAVVNAPVQVLYTYNGAAWVAGQSLVRPISRVVSNIGVFLSIPDTETNVVKLQYSFPTVIGQWYRITFLGTAFATISGSWKFRIRRTTVLTGTTVGEINWDIAASADTRQNSIDWLADVTGTTSFFVSGQRETGTGSLELVGQNRTAIRMCHIPDDTALVP